MRALQDKLAYFESENAGLRDHLMTAETRMAEEREITQRRMLEISNSRENQRLFSDINNLSEQVKIKESQIKYLEHSLATAEQRSFVEKEDFKLENYENYENLRSDNEKLRRELAEEKK